MPSVHHRFYLQKAMRHLTHSLEYRSRHVLHGMHCTMAGVEACFEQVVSAVEKMRRMTKNAGSMLIYMPDGNPVKQPVQQNID